MTTLPPGASPAKAITRALAKAGKGIQAANLAPAAIMPLTPFNAAPREMVIHENRITICGVEVWQDNSYPDLREALIQLCRRGKHGYVRLRGRKLDEHLGRNISNPIAKPLERFCKRAAEVMAQEKGLTCGRYDIIGSQKGGYHYQDWMEVRQEGAAVIPAPVEDSPAPPLSISPDDPPLNERQIWALQQVDKGVLLQLKHLVAEFKTDRSTINRDLKELRGRGLIVTHPKGYSVRAEAVAKAI